MSIAQNGLECSRCAILLSLPSSRKSAQWMLSPSQSATRLLFAWLLYEPLSHLAVSSVCVHSFIQWTVVQFWPPRKLQTGQRHRVGTNAIGKRRRERERQNGTCPPSARPLFVAFESNLVSDHNDGAANLSSSCLGKRPKASSYIPKRFK